MSYVVTAIVRDGEPISVPAGTEVLVSHWGGYLQGTSSEPLLVSDIVTVELRHGSDLDTYKKDWCITASYADPIRFTGKCVK